MSQREIARRFLDHAVGHGWSYLYDHADARGAAEETLAGPAIGDELRQRAGPAGAWDEVPELCDRCGPCWRYRRDRLVLRRYAEGDELLCDRHAE